MSFLILPFRPLDLSPRAERRRWRLLRLRIVFIAGALCVGLVSVLFAMAADWSQAWFGRAAHSVSWLPIVLTPAGFVLSAALARTVFLGSLGSGIPQAIAGRSLRARSDRRLLLSLRIAVGKIGLTLLGLLCGASVGREGPTVQVGAAIMLQVASWGRVRDARGLILAGSAAGIAAAFNTPLAGVVFAIEELSGSFDRRAHGLVLYTVIVAGLVSLGIVGDYSYFGTVSQAVVRPEDWLLVLACGVVGGALGGIFSRCVLDGTRWLRRRCATASLARWLLIAAACGIFVAIVGVLTDGATFGTGYDLAREAVEGNAPSWTFWPAKFAATLATAISGIPGGIFAPSLSVGAGLGSALGGLLPTTSVGLAAVLGMAGYFAGVVQAPMTAFVIIIEMTGGGVTAIPLMVTAVIGYAVSRLVAPESLYHGLAADFLADVRVRRNGVTPSADTPS